MTNQPTSLDEALEQHDVTIALTPGQAILAIIAVLLLIRIVRRLRTRG